METVSCEQEVAEGLGLVGDDALSNRTRVRRDDSAFDVEDADSLRAVDDRDGFDVIVQQEREADRLAKFAVEVAHVRLGDALESGEGLIRFEGRARRGQREEVAGAAFEEALTFERAEDPKDRALRLADALGDFGERKRLGRDAHEIENVDRISDGANEVFGGGSLRLPGAGVRIRTRGFRRYIDFWHAVSLYSKVTWFGDEMESKGGSGEMGAGPPRFKSRVYVVIIETMVHSTFGRVLPALFLIGSLAQALDLKNAVVVTPGGSPMPVQKAGQMLREEVERRSQVRMGSSATIPAGQTAIVVGTNSQLQGFAAELVRQLPAAPQGVEGFRVAVLGKTVVVAGNSERAVVFGAGYLLRHMDMRRGKIFEVADGLKVATAPQIAVRGHQLGFRPKVNAYDAFTVGMFEQYIRDLAVFGTNAIELIPPRSDDADDSPHFPLPKIEMMVEMSRICAEYGLDVWIWFPAIDKDYADPKTVDFAIKEWEEVFKRLPRIDHIFVPGGDPGHTQPKYLLALLEKQTASLHKYHPKAAMWVSPQGFSKEWTDEFYQLLKAEPKWLTGIVHGPQVRDSIPVLRKNVPPRYPIRRYPDITHSINAQYFVPDWDLAYMTTEAREVANPRPTDKRAIFNAYKDYTIGFSTYSEGVNDDVNKIVWSLLGWDPNVDLMVGLAEFGRYFIGEEIGHDFAAGLFALERNWRGPLLTNQGVETTLAIFREMEKRASPQLKLNWRFQQALYRAYYDAYVRHRLINETSLEQQALGHLREAPRVGANLAMQRARQVLDQAVTEPVASDLRGRLMELSEALYQSIHAQLSVEKYQAIAVGRGASSDTADVPLNNRWYLEDRFQAIGALADEKAKLAAIDEIVNWTNPGPGGFYDDLGDLTRQPHLVRGRGYPTDPAHLESSYMGIGRGGVGRVNYVTGYSQAYPRSWLSVAGTLNDTPLKMHYDGLDPQAQYQIRIVYSGGDSEAKVKLISGGGVEIHPWLARPTPVKPLTFDIPKSATASGVLDLTFSKEPGLRGNGRGMDVGEVWVIRKK